MTQSSKYFACIMAGGSGERFWPMSRARTPKHLLKLFSERTLLEEAVHRLEGVVPRENIFVLTNAVQLEGIHAAVRGLIPAANVVAEPAKRDTAPAAALATALVRARGGDDAVVALLPSDSLIKDSATYALQLATAFPHAAGTSALLTFGIKPSFPSTGFGYLELGESNRSFRRVVRFVEKPDLATAQGYLASGRYAWNAGIFVWRAGSFLAETDRNAPALSAFVREFPAGDATAYLATRFPTLPKISVDYAIMEKAAAVETLLAEFDWDDVGTWTALAPHLPTDAAGNATRGAIAAVGSANNIVLSNGRVIALCGVRDLVVVETADAILVCHRDAVQDIKKLQPLLPPATT